MNTHIIERCQQLPEGGWVPAIQLDSADGRDFESLNESFETEAEAREQIPRLIQVVRERVLVGGEMYSEVRKQAWT